MKSYQAPHMQVTHLRLESSICGGSADFIGTGEKELTTIEDQKRNTSFDYTPSQGDPNNGGWDDISTNN